MDLSIIIVTWNSKEFILRCMQSLAHATKGIQAEIIVVDNASSDGTAEAVRDHFPQAQLVCLHENVGFARACNIGIARTQGRFVGFLNPDTEVLSAAFTHLVNFLDRHPRAAAAGGRLMNSDHTLQPSTHVFPNPLTAFAVALKLHHAPFLGSRVRGGFESARIVDTPAPVDYVKGAFFVARKSFLEEVGGFDERYFLWFEEVDLQRTAHARGWSIYYYPRAQAIHWGAQSFSLAGDWRNQRQFLKSMGLYLRKWYGMKGALPVLLVTPFILAGYRLFKRTSHA
jgi:GT2 family glycosyltransferase